MRSMFGELMPREILAYMRDLFDMTREEIVRILSKEFKDFLSRIELERELRNILKTMVVDVKIEVRFRDDDAHETKDEKSTRTPKPGPDVSPDEQETKQAPKKKRASSTSRTKGERSTSTDKKKR